LDMLAENCTRVTGTARCRTSAMTTSSRIMNG
jgi:hypothetical protein